MAINLLDVIREDTAIKHGGFTGAVFLTYSLNLNFFEQIVLPALNEAGCSNVLILADPEGYEQAMDIGAEFISEVGRSYVCVPVPRIGKGIQHSKVLFMAGPARGRLLIGSGNLTYSGYSQNLELYSHFEYDPENGSSNVSPFLQVWGLLQKLAKEGRLSSVTDQQIAALKERATWLKSDPGDSDVIILHNYDEPILDQLLDWRKKYRHVNPSQKVRAISPYYDQGFSAVKQFSNRLQPAQLQIHLDLNLTNLEGKKAKQQWRGMSTKLSAYAIGPGEDQAARRHVHAKAIVGQEENGSWCMSGSANFSHPALLSDWSSGGNLEVVTLFWSADRKTFDYLFKDKMIQSWEIDLASVSTTETGPSEREANHENSNVFIRDLTFRAGRIEGALSRPLPKKFSETNLHFNRKNKSLPVHFEDDLMFTARPDFPLDEAESARIETPILQTSYRWIDQIEVLDRNSARTYQARVKGKTETILGAEKLFEDLMNFLWERFENNPETEDDDPQKNRRRAGKSNIPNAGGNDPLPPGPEGFITEEELVRGIHAGLDYHQPYDRSLYSLQDLLSLVLLRLTTETQVIAVGKNEAADDNEENQSELAELQEQRDEGLGRLKNYVLRYCRKYSERLTNIEFLRKIPLKILLENHYTLGRVLLEIFDKSKKYDLFAENESLECFWLLWSPLALPEIVSLDDPCAFQSLTEKISYEKEKIKEVWTATGISSLFITMSAEFLGQPPSWRSGLWEVEKVENFMTARRWLDKVRSELGSDIFSADAANEAREFGARTIRDLFGKSEVSEEVYERQFSIFSQIEKYRLPIEEKFSFIFDLEQMMKNVPEDIEAKQKLIDHIKAQGMERECTNFLANPKPIFAVLEDEDNNIYCPKCGIKLIEKVSKEILRGELGLCHYYGDAWMYLMPDISKSLF